MQQFVHKYKCISMKNGLVITEASCHKVMTVDTVKQNLSKRSPGQTRHARELSCSMSSSLLTLISPAHKVCGAVHAHSNDINSGW